MIVSFAMAANSLETRTVYRFRSAFGRTSNIYESRSKMYWDEMGFDVLMSGGCTGCCVGPVTGLLVSGDTTALPDGDWLRPRFLAPCGLGLLGSLGLALAFNAAAGKTIPVTQYMYADTWMVDGELFQSVCRNGTVADCESFVSTVPSGSWFMLPMVETLAARRSVEAKRQLAIRQLACGGPLSLRLSVNVSDSGKTHGRPATVLQLLDSEVRGDLATKGITVNNGAPTLRLEVVYIESAYSYLVQTETLAAGRVVMYSGGLGYLYGDETLSSPARVVGQRVIYGAEWHKDAKRREWSTVRVSLSADSLTPVYTASVSNLSFIKAVVPEELKVWLRENLLPDLR